MFYNNTLIMKIVFMGTPDFAVESLRAICDAGYNVVGVVTMPDKPAGRGQKISKSAVKLFAEERGLNILQPEKLKDEAFVEQLRALGADLQIVVAFRMLPEVVWNMPRLGTFNLHASLLPQYRGAAPINWAVMNGDKRTGVTTFKLKHEIDTGDVMFQESIDILPDDNAGTVHDKLMALGSRLVVDTIKAIEEGRAPLTDQMTMTDEELRPAPKLFKDDMKIDWSRTMEQVHNHVRGLSPYPAAWTELTDAKGNIVSAKVFRTAMRSDIDAAPGQAVSDGKTYLAIGCADGALAIEEIQAAGKKRMDIKSFLQGFHLA